MLTKIYGDGVHDDTFAIQQLLDKKGKVTLEDGTYLIKKPLIIHDDTHFSLSKNAVMYLADGANCAIMDNDGLYRRKVNHNIIIEGGIWFGNHDKQERESIPDENVPCDYDKYVENTLTVMMLRFVHVENLTIRNVTFKDPTSFALHIANVKYFTIENVFLDYDLKKPNMDGVHLQGPARFGRVKNVYGNANDDHVALCANGTARSEVTRGVIEDVDIDGVYCDNGYTGVRLLSRGDAVRNITIKNVHGKFRYFAVSFTHHYPLREDMPVTFENVHVSDLYVSKNQEDAYTSFRDGALIYFEYGVNCKNVLIENVYLAEEKGKKLPMTYVGENTCLENVKLKNVATEEDKVL